MISRIIKLFSGLLLLTIISIFWGCDKSKAVDEKSENDDINEVKLVNVRVKTISPSLFTSHLELVGEIKAENDAILSGQVISVLKTIQANKGDHVQKGDTILVLDDKRFRALNIMAVSRYENTKIDFEIARKQHEAGLGVSDLQFKKAENRLLAAKAEMINAEVDFENCFITAPFSGVIAERYIDLGELVSPGTPLIRLLDNSTLRIRSGVPENQSAPIRKGAQAIVRAADMDLELIGRIIWVGAALEPESRTIPIEVSIKANRILKPGMVIELIIEKSRSENAIVIPLSVLQRAPDHSFVYIHSNGKAIYRRVEVGDIDHDSVYIANGLEYGEELIVDGYRDLVDMQPVQVVGKIEG